jgi:hypothetical protein
MNKIPSPDVSRNSLAWLLITQVFLLMPLFFIVPLWVIAVWGLVGLWRWKILTGAWNYPNKLQKQPLYWLHCLD